MSFYLRKGIKVGPFRFNLSKSGVGVSAGIRGLRVGSGPRGNYVHMGRHGVYYRAALPSPGEGREDPAPAGKPQAAPGSEGPGAVRAIDSIEASRIVDSSSREILEELNAKRRRPRLWPWTAAGVALLAAGLGIFGAPWWAILPVLAAGAAAVWLVAQRDAVARTLVLAYELEPEMEHAFARLHHEARRLVSCERAWHVEAEGSVRDRKAPAGAGAVVARSPTVIEKRQPPHVATNIETISIGVGRQTLYLLPDRLLVYDPEGVGAVSYPELEVRAGHTRLVQETSPPRDAKVVDHTWRHPRKDGGPDRRYKDNPQLPICLYGELHLESATGLRERIQLSRADVAEDFAHAVSELARHMSPSDPPPDGSAASGEDA